VRQDVGVPRSEVGPQVTVVVGVDGAGRTHRLEQIAAAAERPVLHVSAGTAPEALAAQLAAAAAAGQLVLVDDAHRLGAEELRLLTASARQGVRMVVARRPTIGGRELADLEEALTAGGTVHQTVHQLAPLDLEAIAALIAQVTGRPANADTCAVVHAASAGLPAVAAAIAATPDGVSPALIARIQRKLALLEPHTAGLARLLALRLELADSVLAAASNMDSERLGRALRALRDEGLLTPGGEAMIPAVAAAVLGDLPAAERRRTHDLVARALVAEGGDPAVAAAQLRAARAFVPAAAGVYAAAGDRLRFEDPAAAVGWYDDAIEAGGEPALVAAGRAEAAALLGLPVDTGQRVEGDGAARLVLVGGAVESHQGRAERSARALASARPPGPLLAVPALIASGQLAEAAAAAGTGDGPVPVHRLAEAALRAVADPAGAVPLFIEAAESLERTPPALVLPDTPHALGALVAAAAGDTASAEHLLSRAVPIGVGGPVAVERHRLLLAWVRLRSGRYDTAVAELGRLSEAALPGRERLLLAALAAGVARRSGDIAKLREAWASVEPVLARRTVDLFAIEAMEELAVAAARLRHDAKMGPSLDDLDGIVARLGGPAAWAVCAGWIRVQVAIATEDADAAAVAAAAIADAGSAAGAAGVGRRQRAQVRAAQLWARTLVGDVDPEAAVAAAEELAAGELPWEGSRLVGQAAIRTTDAAAARRLLERARDLSSAEVVPAGGRAETQYGGLSEREVEVARMVLDGGTYREIGARLFISPKTVEHHVARIRTKLGVTSRAEFIAALRTVLTSVDQPE
jgi:DNA-binding CsgD family transcriptional regulator